ncbi:MAG: hypothetical protein WC755_06545, partial [Candidatus Woesearchaeota archaeon]
MSKEKEIKKGIFKKFNEKLNASSKRKRIFIISTIICVVVVILITILIFSQKVDFILNEELNLDITPNDIIKTVDNNEISEINFTIYNKNFARCNSICEFSLTDLRVGKIVSNETRTLEHQEKLIKYYNISLDAKGSGQA